MVFFVFTFVTLFGIILLREKMSKARHLKIRDLKNENMRLRRENKALKAELSAIRREHSPTKNEARLALESAAKSTCLYQKKSFAAFLVGSLRAKNLFYLYKRLVYIVRKYTFITTTLRILSFILGLIQSGALIVLFTGSLAVSLPITLVFSYSALVFTLIFGKRITKNAREMTHGKNIVLFFPPRRALEKEGFFMGMVADVARNGSLAVIISPYSFLTRGLFGKKSFYLAMRQESERIIIMRPHYFFTFKRRILSHHNKNITFIH